MLEHEQNVEQPRRTKMLESNLKFEADFQQRLSKSLLERFLVISNLWLSLKCSIRGEQQWVERLRCNCNYLLFLESKMKMDKSGQRPIEYCQYFTYASCYFNFVFRIVIRYLENCIKHHLNIFTSHRIIIFANITCRIASIPYLNVEIYFPNTINNLWKQLLQFMAIFLYIHPPYIIYNTDQFINSDLKTKVSI